MKQKRTFITLVLIIAILCLGAAYAAITSQVLTITGNVSAKAGDGAIKVEFTKATVDENSKGTVVATPNTGDDYTKATLDVSDLVVKGDKAIVVYEIENKATDIEAELTAPTVTWDNTEWFNVTCTLSGTTLDTNNAGTTDTQTATVVVELLKTPVNDADQTVATDEITIAINANPVQNSGNN